MPQIGSLPALDVAIGLILVFFVLAQVVSALNELLARALKWRAKFLEEGIRNLLNDPGGTGLTRQILEHPLIRGLQRHGAECDPKKAKWPSYLPSRLFATALFDTLNLHPAPPPSSAAAAGTDPVAQVADNVTNQHVKDSLLALVREAGFDTDKFRAAVEQWYDDAMDRVSGWYTRRAHTVILVLSVALALAINADAIQIASTLWKNDTVRANLVVQATTVAGQNQSTGSAQQRLKNARGQLKNLQQTDNLPIGWSTKKGDPRHVPEFWSLAMLWKLLGILFTGLAVSLGAPFWFDLLGKATRLRSAGAKPAPATDTTK